MSARRPSHGCSTGVSPTATFVVCASLQPPPRRVRSCASASAASGAVGSSVVSPELGPIALALVRREAEPGATVAVGDHCATAVVSVLPFAAG